MIKIGAKLIVAFYDIETWDLKVAVGT
jgi:hypothetical protein